MPWQQLTLNVEENDAALIEEYLNGCGAVSVTLMDAEDQPVFQVDVDTTPIWNSTQVQGLFDHDAPMEIIVASLRENIPCTKKLPIDIEEIKDAEWERVCMQDFVPMRFGENIWICPSWETPPEPNATNIMLDPGLAFGTGTHPTTALCLEWLDQQDIANKTVIDYGCGSGVLAIAAALLGAKEVIAIDNDPQAIIATESNRELNGISDMQLRAYLPGVEGHPKADIIVANILAGPLEALTPIIAALIKPGGKLILSGVLSQQTQSLMNSYQEYFTMLEPALREEWVRVEGIRR